MKLLVIFASLFALGSMTPEQDLSSFEVEYYGEDKGPSGRLLKIFFIINVK